ncbi:uncharacterized protein NPIL_629851 [Nephila pilipes]|uniref:CUB domain-containing protein n=1 Tax=Nephila pilipes TaxID=299642 RepID=A0A8X6R277_NEPPI|nr:uncharacterized protein NPIL_629851 [Nephila pilipes]
MEISVKWIALGILCLKISIVASFYPEYIIEDLCKYGNETIIYETSSKGIGTLKATSHPPYQPNKNCTIIIKPPSDRGIVLSIRKVDFREWKYFCFDYLLVFHSDISTSPSKICRFQFDLEEKVSFYQKGPMTMVYHIDHGKYPAFSFEEGFTLTYTVVAEDFQDCVKDDVFMCDNGRCISKDLTCDGRNNCGDRSDESHVVCDSGLLDDFQMTDKMYVIIFSILCSIIFISISIVFSRRRMKRIVDSDPASDVDEPTARLAPYQAVHPSGFFICQNPAGPDSQYPHQFKVVQMEGGFSNPCYPNGVPNPPPPYSQ